MSSQPVMRALQSDDPQQAYQLAEVSFRAAPGPETATTLALALSELGRRTEATRYLVNALKENPRHGLAYALLGEQQIRQGDWDRGTQNILEGLSHDDDGRASDHVRQVLRDLVDAVAQKRLPQPEGLKFINRLAYTGAGSRPDLSTFLAECRFAMTQHQPLIGARQRAVPPPQHLQKHHVPLPPSPPQERPLRQRRGNPLAAIMHEERLLNEQLQEGLDGLNTPQWPTQRRAEPLDTVPPAAAQRTLTEEYGEMEEQADYQLTSGSLECQIFLERCRQGLLQAASSAEARAVPLAPRSITQMEFNCHDGLLQRLPPLDAVSTQAFLHGGATKGYGDYALGSFLGECIARSFEGSWQYGEQPAHASVVVGGERLEPIRLAQRWLQAEDKGDVLLEALVEEARRSMPPRSLWVPSHDVIDSTMGLTGEALAPELVDLYMDYRFAQPPTSRTSLLKSLRTLLVRETLLVFALDRRHVPIGLVHDGRGWGMLSRDTIVLAFLCDQGIFHALTHVKAMAACLDVLYDALTPQNLPQILNLFDHFFLPTHHVVLDNASLQQLTRQHREDDQLRAFVPKLDRDRSGDAVLQFCSALRGSLTVWEVRCMAGDRWRVQAG